MGNFFEDRQGLSEIMGLILILMITILLFTVLYTTVTLFIKINPSMNVVIQGTIYEQGNNILLTNVGGEPVKYSDLHIVMFVNDSDFYEPNYIPYTHNHIQDYDGIWGFSDRLLLQQDVYNGSTIEAFVINDRINFIVGKVNLYL